MERKDLVLIGHFALDTIINTLTNSTGHSLGGGVTYGSLAAAYFDPKAAIGVVSRIGADFDRNLLSIFQGHNIDLSGIVQEGPHSTRFQLTYHKNGRDLKSTSRAPPFKITDFPKSFIHAKAIHMTPIANEFTTEFIEDLANHDLTQDSLIGIDVQGIIRDFTADGSVIMRNDPQIRAKVYRILQHFGERMIFKASDMEAVAVTGITDLIKATEYLAATGAYIYTTMGGKGLYFKAPNHPIINLAAYSPDRCVDETGCGDCFMAVLLLQLAQIPHRDRTYEKIIEVTKNASAAASFLIEEKGPNGFHSKTAILERVKANKTL
jgi:sugar/nucleoside kinase (ribokinase family)